MRRLASRLDVEGGGAFANRGGHLGPGRLDKQVGSSTLRLTRDGSIETPKSVNIKRVCIVFLYVSQIGRMGASDEVMRARFRWISRISSIASIVAKNHLGIITSTPSSSYTVPDGGPGRDIPRSDFSGSYVL